MTCANEYFYGYKFDFNKLLDYGFKSNKDKYVFSKNLDSNLLLKIEIDNYGCISFIIWDNDFNDECLSYNTSPTIKSLWNNVFDDIKDKCCYKQKYKSDQANLVDKFIKDSFNVDAEFLWEKYPEFGVYRNMFNKKWFAIIMNIDYSTIDKSKSGQVCVVDIKSNEIQNLLKQQSFYPAYLMNKNNWITMVLDNTISLEIIFNLIKHSYELVNNKKG